MKSRLEEMVIIMGKKYIDGISLDLKNQTASLLERYYFIEVNNECYISMINEESEEYCGIPTVEQINEETYRVVNCAKNLILNTSINKTFMSDKEAFRMSFCGLDALLDKVLAVIIADVLDKQEKYETEEEFVAALLTSAFEIKSIWNSDDQEENYIISEENANKFEIDTSNLTIGMTVKNYRVLCELLEQPEKGGKSRKYQLDDFKRYFDWEKSGQKFIITDIYDEPLTKEDKRKLGNNSIYVKYIEVILLQYLSKQKGFTRTLTKRNWWEILGITNYKYGRVPENQLKKLDYTVTSFEIKHFYQRCNKRLEQILFSALNSLKNRKLIEYEVQTVIVKHDQKKKEQYFLAMDDDKKRILETEHYVLHKVMGFEKMFQIFIRFKQGEFYEKVNELLNENYGWDYYFRQIKIIFISKDVKEALPELETKLQKELLNQKVIECLNSNAKKFYVKKKEEYEQGIKNLLMSYTGERLEDKKKEAKLWDVPNTYLTAQNILTEELVRIGHRNLTFSVEDFLESNTELDDLFLCDK
jgi:hypothetical protein